MAIYGRLRLEIQSQRLEVEDGRRQLGEEHRKTALPFR
jgi:hypothetical protein